MQSRASEVQSLVKLRGAPICLKNRMFRLSGKHRETRSLKSPMRMVNAKGGCLFQGVEEALVLSTPLGTAQS